MHVTSASYVTPAIKLPREVVPPSSLFLSLAENEHFISFAVILSNFSDFFQKWNTFAEIPQYLDIKKLLQWS